MMKNIKLNYWIMTLLSIMLITVSCERGLSDDIKIAKFPSTGDIFLDEPVGLNDSIFISFDPAEGANVEGFDVDRNVAFEGTSSIRIDVPTPTDPDGGFIGGIFKDRGEGRDLTGYDALTFWVKGSTTATVGVFGFGSDFDADKYAVSVENVELSTAWRQVIIPIPDPSKLVQEKGLFLFSAGSESTNGAGYTFWLDEIRFEKLGTLGQPRPKIQGGQDQVGQANVGTSLQVQSLTYTANRFDGEDVTVIATPAYFDFETSNPFVASVDDIGSILVVGPGVRDPNTGSVDNTAVITASIGDIQAEGSLTIEAVDIDIIAVFSDVFAEVPVDNYNGFYLGDGQTTEGGFLEEDGNNIIDYTDLNFVAIEFYGRDGSGVIPLDVTDKEFLHIDVRVNEAIEAADFFRIEMFNNFATGNQIAGSFTIAGNELRSNEFVPFDIPMSAFEGSGLSSRDAVGAFIFVSGGIENVSLDNIYFYTEN